MIDFIDYVVRGLGDNVRVSHNKHYKVTLSKDITISGKEEMVIIAGTPSDKNAVRQVFRDFRRHVKDSIFNYEFFKGSDYEGMFFKKKKKNQS